METSYSVTATNSLFMGAGTDTWWYSIWVIKTDDITLLKWRELLINSSPITRLQRMKIPTLERWNSIAYVIIEVKFFLAISESVTNLDWNVQGNAHSLIALICMSFQLDLLQLRVLSTNVSGGGQLFIQHQLNYHDCRNWHSVIRWKERLLEIILPVLAEPRVAFVGTGLQSREVFIESFQRPHQRLHRHRSFDDRLVAWTNNSNNLKNLLPRVISILLRIAESISVGWL